MSPASPSSPPLGGLGAGLGGSPFGGMCGGPEHQELDKISTLNAIEMAKAQERLRAVIAERDDASTRYSAQFEKNRLEMAPLENELHRLQMEAALREEKRRKDAEPLRAEQEALSLSAALEEERLHKELAPLRAELERLQMEMALNDEKLRKELASAHAERDRLQLEASLNEEKLHKELAAARAEQERRHVQNEVDREKFVAEEIKADGERLKMELAMRQLDFESRKLKMDEELSLHKTVALRADLDLRAKKEDWKKEANKEPEYPAQPFKDGVLTLSDRRLTIDGPIVFGMADYVTERIHYFNNKDETLPIFVVIDDSPGGSVMEGYRIVKAIQASKAPVHVVVKSFAASMAAVITTLAPHSYAYPNAVMIHHQMSSGAFGNMTEQAEQLELNKEWFRRLGVPVAEKMGTSLEGWVKEMYKHNSDGDWEEFADKAVKLKWVDHIVHEIRETGIVKSPEDKSDEKPKMKFGLAEETDSHGDRFVRLPRLRPFDAYWIYNPGNYYR